MEDCLFCRICDKKSPSSVVYEDESTLAFLDIMPRAPGHTMVIPKRHCENILDLPDGEFLPLFRTVATVTRRIMEVLKPDGFTIGINHGEVSGQVVKHFHIHVIPRFKDDSGRAVQSVVHNPPAKSLEEIQAMLKMP